MMYVKKRQSKNITIPNFLPCKFQSIQALKMLVWPWLIVVKGVAICRCMNKHIEVIVKHHATAFHTLAKYSDPEFFSSAIYHGLPYARNKKISRGLNKNRKRH